MCIDKKFFILISQFCIFIFNLIILIVSICLLNSYGIFSLGSDIVLTLSQKLFVALFTFVLFSFIFLIIFLIFDIISFCHSYSVKKRDLLIKEISLQVHSNLPCYCYSEIDDLKK